MTTDKTDTAAKRYYYAHREEILAKRRQIHAEHREELNRKSREWRQRHLEQERAKGRARMRKARMDPKVREHYKQLSHKWYLKNRDKHIEKCQAAYHAKKLLKDGCTSGEIPKS